MTRLLLLTAVLLSGCTSIPKPCVLPDRWIAPATAQAIDDPLPGAAYRAVVLLGEHHDSAADHRWQLATIRELHLSNPELALGFEMFPRSAQPALDEWVAGRSSEAEFLDRTDWAHVWGLDAELYLPIFRFAREQHVPMVALNVSKALPKRVAREGWAAIAPAEREGIGDPSPPTPSYKARLVEALGGHDNGTMSADHFIEAQLVWDRAMAEAIAASHRFGRKRLIVAIMGSGHLESGEGVPYQLRALGITDMGVFLPIPPDETCTALKPGLADAVYVTDDR